jgi:hypothetical protein
MVTVLEDRMVKCERCEGSGEEPLHEHQKRREPYASLWIGICYLCNGTGWGNIEVVEVAL